MAKRVYVGNMSFDTTEDKLRELFAEHGEVNSVNVVTDRYTGRPKGFAFVEMETDEAANAAIAALNSQVVDGRELRVDEARPRKPRGGDRGGGGGYDRRRW
jgi:RNA recognition motif-containing protein